MTPGGDSMDAGRTQLSAGAVFCVTMLLCRRMAMFALLLLEGYTAFLHQLVVCGHLFWKAPPWNHASAHARARSHIHLRRQ